MKLVEAPNYEEVNAILHEVENHFMEMVV